MRALLEAVDLVLDVLGVRVDGRRDDLGEVVGEEIGRVEARVARPIPPALPVFGTTGKEAEATGTAAPNATERLYYQRHYLVTLPCYMCSGSRVTTVCVQPEADTRRGTHGTTHTQ